MENIIIKMLIFVLLKVDECSTVPAKFRERIPKNSPEIEIIEEEIPATGSRIPATESGISDSFSEAERATVKEVFACCFCDKVKILSNKIKMRLQQTRYKI